MSEDHAYDEDAARQELAVYETTEAERRRRFVRDRLGLSRAETVASIGCGPGFEPAEIAAALGGSGRVIGVDASPAMLELARSRCKDQKRVSLARGDATALPLPDDAVDAVTAVQLLEYLPDPDAALAEFRRLLRSGGRAVVLDTDWRTFVWRADDDERSQAVLDAWEDRCPHPRIGSALAPRLRDAGFIVEAVEPFTIAEETLEDSFFGHNLPFVVDHTRTESGADGALPRGTADAWEADVRSRDSRGETFVSLTQYCYVATAP